MSTITIESNENGAITVSKDEIHAFTVPQEVATELLYGLFDVLYPHPLPSDDEEWNSLFTQDDIDQVITHLEDIANVSEYDTMYSGEVAVVDRLLAFVEGLPPRSTIPKLR